LANTASAIKRVRSNARKRIRNREVRATTRTKVTAARSAIAHKKDDPRAAVLTAVSALDKAAQKGVIHKKNAARRKGRLMKKLAAAQGTKK
jgi:small subunit ribosomal protein S20